MSIGDISEGEGTNYDTCMLLEYYYSFVQYGNTNQLMKINEWNVNRPRDCPAIIYFIGFTSSFFINHTEKLSR